MKILMNPMTAHRATAIEKINTHFVKLAGAVAPIERVYARKREIAMAVMEGAALADDHPFVSEARLRGLPSEEFARDIIYKPDIALAADYRELERQKFLLRVKAAATPGAIAEVLFDASISG